MSKSTKTSKTTSKPKADDLVDSLFAGIEDDTSAPPRKSTSSDKKPLPRKDKPSADDEDEKALLAELEGLTAEHRSPSRPVTPRVPGGGKTSTDSPKRSL